jgi:hypothetical protein
MQSDSLARTWISLVGIILVAVGLLGFVSNPIVGQQSAIFPTGNLHNVVHILTGALALYIGFGLKGETQINAVIGFGLLYAVIFVALIVSNNLFGLFEYPVNLADHLLHAGVAIVSIGLGYMARGSATTMSSGMNR